VELDRKSGALVIPFEDGKWVQTRRDLDDGGDQNSLDVSLSALAGLSPVSVARAAKGRGATGRGAGGFKLASKTSHGRAWFYGGAYANGWYDDHDDEVEQVPVQVKQVGIAYLGDNEQFEEQDPGPGPVDWDETYEPPENEGGKLEIAPEELPALNNLKVGWYRAGTQVVVDNKGRGNDKVQNLGWECVDIRVENKNGEKTITERWKVSPRI
jgi:hypothetical protein